MNTPTAQPRRGDTFGRRFTRHSRVTPRPCRSFRAKDVFVGLTHGSRRGLPPAALRAKNRDAQNAFVGRKLLLWEREAKTSDLPETSDKPRTSHMHTQFDRIVGVGEFITSGLRATNVGRRGWWRES